METITLPRVTLRPFRRTDGEGLWRLLREEPVAREWGAEESLDECIHLSLLWEREEGIWACCLGDEEGPLMGQVRLCPLPERGRGVRELSYAFHPGCWGRGYALESCRGLLLRGFQEWGMKRAVAFCGLSNLPSIRLLERLGMKRRKEPRQGLFLREGQWRAGWEYALSRPQFERSWKG